MIFLKNIKGVAIFCDKQIGTVHSVGYFWSWKIVTPCLFLTDWEERVEQKSQVCFALGGWGTTYNKLGLLRFMFYLQKLRFMFYLQKGLHYQLQGSQSWSASLIHFEVENIIAVICCLHISYSLLLVDPFTRCYYS